MKNIERWANDYKIGIVGEERGLCVSKEGIEESEKFLFLSKRLEAFYQNKAGSSFEIMNRRLRKDVYRKLADLLNDVSYICQKKEQDRLLEKVYTWYLRKVGVCGNEDLNRENLTEKSGKFLRRGDDEARVKVEDRRKLDFSILRSLEIKHREQNWISDILGKSRNRRNCVSFSLEPKSSWILTGNHNFSCYKRGRSLENREIKTVEKIFLKTDPMIPKIQRKKLKISGDLILKLNTVQESAKKCFQYSRRIFRKKK